MADDLIQEETDSLLKKYEAKQGDLLGEVKQERIAIQQEIERLQNLSSTPTLSSKSISVKLLATATTLFAVAAIVYAWSALANSDKSALNSAVIDAAVAACSAYFLSKQSKLTK